MITTYAIYDNWEERVLAVTLSKSAAVRFVENYLRAWSGKTEEEITEEIENMLDEDCGGDATYSIKEVPYTDGTYERTDDYEGIFMDPEEEKKLKEKYDKGL